MSQGKTVAFLESRAQAEAALALSPRPETLVALAPEAAYALEEAGAEYVKAESLYDEARLAARGDEVLDAQRAWADWVDGLIRSRRPDLDPEFRPARWHLFHIKRLFDTLLYRAQALDAVGRALSPSRVVYFASPAPDPLDWTLSFNGSAHALCTKAWARSFGAEAVERPSCGDERFVPPRRARRWPGPTAVWSRLRREALLRAPAVGPAVLVEPTYDVGPMLGPLRRRGLKPLAWGGLLKCLPTQAAPLGSRPPISLAEISADPRWSAPSKPLGLDLSAVAQSRLAYWWESVVPRSWAAFDGARPLLRERKVAAVVVPIADSPEEVGVVRAARREGIPVAVYQHGGFAGACEYPGWEITDLDQADVMLFYGDGSAGHYRERLRRYAEPKARPVSVGSARLEALALPSAGRIAALRRRLSAGLAPGSRLLLYFPTMHAGYSRYLCYGELPDVSHWELQRDILRLAGKAPGVRVVYRPFEGFFASPVPRLIAREGLDAVVERDATLAELARACDAVVCDIPSTGLLETLLPERPTFVYSQAGSVRLTPEAEASLSKRAHVSREKAPFLAALSAWLAGGPAPGDPSDRSFMRAYATHADDGRSAERAADVVRGLVRA